VWTIKTTDRFDAWFKTLCAGERACVMKELRVQSRGNPIRVFFAFDTRRAGVLLCAGNKVGNEKRFYDQMIPIADREFSNYLNRQETKE